MTLRPLMLDDIRIAGPNRDEAEAFDPSETWATACDRINEGYSVGDVADLLLDLDDDERRALADYWRDHTLNTIQAPALDGRDFQCPDIRLALALQERDPDCDEWSCAPTLDPESLWETVREFDRLRAENARLQAALAAPRRVVIGVEGGIVQGASADGPCMVVVLDYDTDGDRDALVVPQSGEGEAEAWVHVLDAETGDDARAWVEAIHTADSYPTVAEHEARQDDEEGA